MKIDQNIEMYFWVLCIRGSNVNLLRYCNACSFTKIIVLMHSNFAQPGVISLKILKNLNFETNTPTLFRCTIKTYNTAKYAH